jgi:hypothetical protein
MVMVFYIIIMEIVGVAYLKMENLMELEDTIVNMEK